MSSLSDAFSALLHAIGMEPLQHPLFYHAPIGIRFEIGHCEPVFLRTADTQPKLVNPAYLIAAFARASTLYEALPHPPNILRIDGNPKLDTPACIRSICQATKMPPPHQQTHCNHAFMITKRLCSFRYIGIFQT